MGIPGQMCSIWHTQWIPLLKTVHWTVFNSPLSELLTDGEFRPLRRATKGSAFGNRSLERLANFLELVHS